MDIDYLVLMVGVYWSLLEPVVVHWSPLKSIGASEGRESWSRLGQETEGTKTLGLVQNFGYCLVSVSSLMEHF